MTYDIMIYGVVQSSGHTQTPACRQAMDMSRFLQQPVDVVGRDDEGAIVSSTTYIDGVRDTRVPPVTE